MHNHLIKKPQIINLSSKKKSKTIVSESIKKKINILKRKSYKNANINTQKTQFSVRRRTIKNPHNIPTTPNNNVNKPLSIIPPVQDERQSTIRNVNSSKKPSVQVKRQATIRNINRLRSKTPPVRPNTRSNRHVISNNTDSSFVSISLESETPKLDNKPSPMTCVSELGNTLDLNLNVMSIFSDIKPVKPEPFTEIFQSPSNDLRPNISVDSIRNRNIEFKKGAINIDIKLL